MISVMSEYHRIKTGDAEVVTDNLEKAMIHFFPDSIHSVDKNGEILFANNAAAKLFGYSVDELAGKPITEIYAPEVASFVEAGFERLKRQGSCSVQSTIQDKSGQHIPVEVRSFCIYSEQGEFERTITVTRDLRNYMYAVSRNPTDTGWEVQWASEQGATYTIEWTEDLESEFVVVNSGVEAEPPINTYVDFYDRKNPGVYRISKDC